MWMGTFFKLAVSLVLIGTMFYRLGWLLCVQFASLFVSLWMFVSFPEGAVKSRRVEGVAHNNHEPHFDLWHVNCLTGDLIVTLYKGGRRSRWLELLFSRTDVTQSRYICFVLFLLFPIKYFLAVYTILFCLFLYVCLLLYAIVSHGLSQHSGW